jgi:hypothetical protein
MGGMPVDICKVSILKRVDELSRDPAKRGAFLAGLEDRTKDLATTLVEHQPSIQDILRQGLLRAFEEAKAHNLPIDSYWICAGNQFAMYVTRSAQQVTCIILTPSIASELMAAVQAIAARETPGAPAPIWAINREGTIQVPRTFGEFRRPVEREMSRHLRGRLRL